MKISNVTRHFILIILGIIALAVGFLVLGDKYKSVSGLCIGIGAGVVGMSIANLIITLYYRKHPDIKKLNDIESKDERTIIITNKAKAKSFDIIIKILMIIPFLMILIDLPLWMIFATIALYLFGFFAQIYLTIRYSKEM